MQRDSPRKNSNLQAMRTRLKVMVPSMKTRESNSLLNSPTYTIEEPSLSPQPKENIEWSSATIHYNKFLPKNAFEQRYEILEKLGEGANGVVRKCRDKATQEIFAVKIGQMEQQHVVALRQIVNLMRHLKHPNVLQMKELYVDSSRSKYYHVIEYLPYPSVKQIIHRQWVITPNIVKKIMKQLLSGLFYLHRHHIVHRDIKTSNLLFDMQKEQLHIIDLGLITKTVQRGKRRNLWSNNGTLEYKPPEMMHGQDYNESVDLWAAGVVLYELVEGRTPFIQETQMDTIDNIRQIKYTFSPQIWADITPAKDLVMRLLRPKAQRLTAKEALQAPWFQTLDWESMTISKEPPNLKFSQPDSSQSKYSIFGSAYIVNRQRNTVHQQMEFQGLNILPPNMLRMSSYDHQQRQSPNLADLIGNNEDDMIINNNS